VVIHVQHNDKILEDTQLNGAEVPIYTLNNLLYTRYKPGMFGITTTIIVFHVRLWSRRYSVI